MKCFFFIFKISLVHQDVFLNHFFLNIKSNWIFNTFLIYFNIKYYAQETNNNLLHNHWFIYNYEHKHITVTVCIKERKIKKNDNNEILIWETIKTYG